MVNASVFLISLSDFSSLGYRNAAKAVLRGKFIAIQSYLKKKETSQINNLTLQLKQLEKEEQNNPKIRRRKEIIKIRLEINEGNDSKDQ